MFDQSDAPLWVGRLASALGPTVRPESDGRGRAGDWAGWYRVSMRTIPLPPLQLDPRVPLPCPVGRTIRPADVAAWPASQIATALQLPEGRPGAPMDELSRAMGTPRGTTVTRREQALRLLVTQRAMDEVLATPSVVGSGALNRASRWLSEPELDRILVEPLISRWEALLQRGEVSGAMLDALAAETLNDVTILLPLLRAGEPSTPQANAQSVARGPLDADAVAALLRWSTRATEAASRSYPIPPTQRALDPLQGRWGWAPPAESWEPVAAGRLDASLLRHLQQLALHDPDVVNTPTMAQALWGRIRVLLAGTHTPARVATVAWLTQLGTTPVWGAKIRRLLSGRKLTELLQQDTCPDEVWHAIVGSQGLLADLVAPRRWKLDRLPMPVTRRVVDHDGSRWWEAVSAWMRASGKHPMMGQYDMERWLEGRAAPPLSPTQWVTIVTSEMAPLPNWGRQHLPEEAVRAWGPAEWKRLLMHPQQEVRLWAIQLQGQHVSAGLAERALADPAVSAPTAAADLPADAGPAPSPSSSVPVAPSRPTR